MPRACVLESVLVLANRPSEQCCGKVRRDYGLTIAHGNKRGEGKGLAAATGRKKESVPQEYPKVSPIVGVEWIARNGACE